MHSGFIQNTNDKQWFFNLLSRKEYENIETVLLKKGASYLWNDVPCYIKAIQHHINCNVNIEVELIKNGKFTTYKPIHIDEFKELLRILNIKINILFTKYWKPHHKEILEKESNKFIVVNHDGKMMLDDSLIDYFDPTSDHINMRALFLHSLCLTWANQSLLHKHKVHERKSYLEALINKEFCISINCLKCFPSLLLLKNDILDCDIKRRKLLVESKKILVSKTDNPFDDEVKSRHYKKKKLIQKAKIEPKIKIIKKCIEKHSNDDQSMIVSVGDAIHNSYGQKIQKMAISDVNSTLITADDEPMNLIDADGNLFKMSTHEICKDFLLTSNCKLVLNADFTISNPLTDVDYGCIIMNGKNYYYENVRRRYNVYFRCKYDWHFSRFMIPNLPLDFNEMYLKHFIGEYSTSEYYDIPKSFTYIQEGYC